jgi:hypothetical protein
MLDLFVCVWEGGSVQHELLDHATLKLQQRLFLCGSVAVVEEDVSR